jgi:hypothetical protein
MEATSVFLAVRSSDDVMATIAESQEVFSLWSAPRLYTEVHRAIMRIIENREIVEIGVIENEES